MGHRTITADGYDHGDYEDGSRAWIRANLQALLGEYRRRHSVDEIVAEVQYEHVAAARRPDLCDNEFALFCLDEYDRVETEALAALREIRAADQDARRLEVESRRW